VANDHQEDSEIRKLVLVGDQGAPLLIDTDIDDGRVWPMAISFLHRSRRRKQAAICVADGTALHSRRSRHPQPCEISFGIRI
jgi:hypothetical protein